MPLILLMISIYDVRNHRIPNYAVALVLLAQLILEDLAFNKNLLLPILLFAVLSKVLCNLGGGDIKLIVTLSIFCLPQGLMDNFIVGIVVFSMLTMCIYAWRFHNLRIAVPLAPAISGGYLWAIAF